VDLHSKILIRCRPSVTFSVLRNYFIRDGPTRSYVFLRSFWKRKPLLSCQTTRPTSHNCYDIRTSHARFVTANFHPGLPRLSFLSFHTECVIILRCTTSARIFDTLSEPGVRNTKRRKSDVSQTSSQCKQTPLPKNYTFTNGHLENID
jgi:hypothetical protein